MRRSLFALTFAAAFVCGIFPSRAGELDRNTEGQDVTVNLTSPFSNLPPGGCVPFRVSIRNDRAGAGTWQISFQGTANSSTLGATILKQEFSVGPKTTGSFDVLVPLPIVAEDRGNTVLNVSLTGPGFNNSGKQFFAYFYSNGNGSRLPFTVIGGDVLGNIGLGPLNSYCKAIHREFYGSEVAPADFPSDWRAYSGVAKVILKDDGWLGLNAAQRDAISNYVAQGGRLILFTADAPETKTPELQLPTSGGKAGTYGFGTISVVSSPAFPPDGATLYEAAVKNPMNSAFRIDKGFSSWGLRLLVGTIAVSAVFILSFVILFGGLVGPINIFVFARGPNRFRLFWTTPLISLAACLALIAGILLTDGIGGTGRQMIAIFSLPGQNREAIIQEQVARTAVLFSNHWHNDQDYLLTPVSGSSLNDAMTSIGHSVYGSRRNLDDSPDIYRQDGNEFSGNWFRSRSISGQYLQAIRPTRSTLTVLNPLALDSHDEAPIVLSSFPQELEKVFLVDSKLHYWTCDHLEPGHKKTCTPCKVNELNVFWHDACANAGGKLEPLLREARAAPAGRFFATGTPTATEILATLGEVRWQVMSGVYLGPWVASPTEEGAP